MTHPALHLSATIASKVLALVACGALFVSMVLTFVDVIGRYGFHNSIFGVSEIVELLMVAIVFGGFAFVTASDEHISVTLVDHLLVARAPALMGWVKFLFSCLIYLLFLWIFWDMAIEALGDARETIVLSLPLWLFSGTAAIMSTLGFVLFLITYRRNETGQGGSQDV